MQTARLLIIEEDPERAGLLSDLAQRCGFETAIAAAAREVPRLVSELRPTSVFVDASMHDLAGVESLLALSQLSCDADIIACGEANPRLMDAIWRFGRVNGLTLVDVLAEPLDLPTVEAILASLNPAGARGIPVETASA